MRVVGKLNKAGVRPNVKSAIVSEKVPSGRTFQGAAGYAREPKGELFLLAVSNFVSENSFYENANSRDERFESLVAQVAIEDVEWLTEMVTWLRGEANMRSASIVAACIAVKARLDNGLKGNNRQLINAACRRADEPGDVLSYWLANFGKPIPSAVKRGLFDAANRLYNEKSLLKYDSSNAGVRFSDVIMIAEMNRARGIKADLYAHAIDRRYGVQRPIPESLTVINQYNRLIAQPVENRRKLLAHKDFPKMMASAGMTWESLAGWLQGPMDAQAWESIIPQMGLMALSRNLRNFDQAGVSDEVAAQICAKFADPEQVSRSRMLPYRWYTAHRMTPSLRWGHALDQALTSSLANIPVLKGRTLILVDTSGSMRDPFSKDGTVMRWDAATLFGVALAHRCESANLHSFSDRMAEFPLQKGESLLKSIDRWKNNGFFFGQGTYTHAALTNSFNNHDRVVIFTDEQAAGSTWRSYTGNGQDQADVHSAIPANVPLYTWNLAGLRYGHAPSGTKNRHVFGGLTDQMLKVVPMLESGQRGSWPWSTGSATKVQNSIVEVSEYSLEDLLV